MFESMNMQVSGILNVNKPKGVTSRDVVNQVSRSLQIKKVGHAGTLDPLASGVLILCVGRATRLIETIQQQPKRYHGTFLLGCTSDTEDTEGEVTSLSDPPIPTLDQLQNVLPMFTGNILQQPPVYSAKKIAGRRAYDLARAGKEVNLPAAAVEVYELKISRYEYPDLELDICCGSGTYVRSLGRDIAAAVQSGAVMSALVRSGIGDFRLEQAKQVEDLSKEELVASLLPMKLAVGHLPQLTLDELTVTRLCHGQSVQWSNSSELPSAPSEIAVLDTSVDHRLRALVTFKNGTLKAKRVFPLD